MSIEDINYLKEHSIKQSYTFLVDSKSRDYYMYPTPSEYRLEFTVPFRHVIGIEVVDVSIPKTMYNIDYNNNRLYYYLAANEADKQVVIVGQDQNGNDLYDKSKFSYVELPPGDYTTTTFIDAMRLLMNRNKINLMIASVDTPAELTNLIYFRSSQPFILDMQQSTMAEVLGFDMFTSSKLSINKSGIRNYEIVANNAKKGFEKLYHSYHNTTGMHTVYAPGMMYLLGNKYIVLKCPEIEQHLYRSLSYSKYNMGLAKIRLNNYGYNDEKTSFLKVPIREFHPIGKLSKMTLRFETNTGDLYDFKGVNHNVVFAIYYYEPKKINVVIPSRLNPDYDPNMVNYLRSQDEQQGESDDSDDDENSLSRDNLQIYKKRELEYNANGIESRNNAIALQRKQLYDSKILQYEKLKQMVYDKTVDSDSDDNHNMNISNKMYNRYNSNDSDNSNNSDDSDDSNDSNESE